MEQLYREYRDRVFRITLSILKDPALAEEAAQLCWEKLLRRPAGVPLPQGQALRGYLSAAAKHAALDILRREPPPAEPLTEDWDAPGPHNTEGESDYRAIVAVIRAMPEEYRQVLELKFVLEYDNRAIAKETGLSPGAVAGRIRRGRALLIEALRKEGYTYGQVD